MKCEQASTGKADELSTNSISPLEASNLRQPRGTQSEREPMDQPHCSCYAGLILYSHEIRFQNNELEPQEKPYVLILERINCGRNDFLHIIPIKLCDEDNRSYVDWTGIEGKHFATALKGKGFCRVL